MKRQSILVLAIAFSYSAASANFEAVVEDNDRNVHSIDCVSRGGAEYVKVANRHLAEVTKANVVPVSLMSGPFMTFDDSEVGICASSKEMTAYALWHDGRAVSAYRSNVVITKQAVLF